MRTSLNECPFYEEIIKIVDKENIKISEPMSRHTTFKTGGEADYYIEVSTSEQLSKLVRYFNLIEKEYYVVGNGSNLLVGDKGYRGVILVPSGDMKEIIVTDDTITAGAGALLVSVSKEAQRASLTGMEFASGIPGSVGGAVVMNAGAYGGEMSQILVEVEAVTESGEIITLKNDELMLGYRTSIFKKKKLVCTKATLRLESGVESEIFAKMDDFSRQRREKQPIEFPSAGSTFKRPEGYFAGKLIMDAGLRGFQIGGARVSDKHCGFIINAGGATSADVLDLMNEVEEKVYRLNGVRLEPEVCMIGEF